MHAEKICASFIFLKTNICENFMEMLLYELWLFLPRCEALDSTFWNMFMGPGLAPHGRPKVKRRPAPRVPLSCVFLILLMFKKKSFLFFKKSNFLFMKQYKLDAFSKQFP